MEISTHKEAVLPAPSNPNGMAMVESLHVSEQTTTSPNTEESPAHAEPQSHPEMAAVATTIPSSPALMTAEGLLAKMNITSTADVTIEIDPSPKRVLDFGPCGFCVLASDLVVRRWPGLEEFDRTINHDKAGSIVKSASSPGEDSEAVPSFPSEQKAAAVVVLSIAHGKFENVPLRASARLVYEVIIFARKHSMLPLLRPYARNWAEFLGQRFQARSTGMKLRRDWSLKLVNVFWELGAPKLFAEVVRALALYSPPRDVFLDEHILPPGVYGG